MSRLKISDISFFEAELTNSNQVIGGAITSGGSNPYGAWASSYDTSVSSGYVANYSLDTDSGVLNYTIGGFYSGAVAGAIAAAVTDGNGGFTVFATAFAST